MKINKKNVIIPSLLTTISAALVGSIAGTVAWYQYNTRVSASYYGTSAGSATENLQLSLTGAEDSWKTELRAADIQAYLDAHGHNGSNLRPVTTGEHKKDGELGSLYKNPIYQHEKTETWGEGDAKDDFITFPIHLRVLDIDGKQSEDARVELEKAIYLQNVVLKGSQTNDITDALRLHVSGLENKFTLSDHGQDTKTHGALDLLNDGVNQKDKSEGYEDLGDDVHVIDYGVDPAIIKGYVEHEADLLNDGDYFKVTFDNDDASDDKFYQFDLENGQWNVLDAAPAAGRDRGEVAKVADLPALVAINEIYFASEDNMLFILDENDGWIEKKVVAESYATSDAEVIADDSDPENLQGGKSLGKTRASVYKAANLPAEGAHAGDKIYVREDTIVSGNVTAAKGMYEFDGSDWKLIDLEENDKFFQYDDASSQWVEVDAQPGEGQDLGEVDEESLLPENPNDKDYVKVIYASEDAENDRKDLTLNLTIYLEGWQELASSSTWASGYIGTEYKVGMTFVCEAR